MSSRNSPLSKALRRQKRSARQMRSMSGQDRAGNPIHFGGVNVSSTLVRQHRYLRLNGKGHSETLANVPLRADTEIGEDETQAILNGGK